MIEILRQDIPILIVSINKVKNLARSVGRQRGHPPEGIVGVLLLPASI